MGLFYYLHITNLLFRNSKYFINLRSVTLFRNHFYTSMKDKSSLKIMSSGFDSVIQQYIQIFPWISPEACFLK